MKSIIIILLIFIIAVSGCTTSCIPVTPTEKYPISDSDYGVFIIGGKSMSAYPSVYKSLESNKTTMVRFETRLGETIISSVCSP